MDFAQVCLTHETTGLSPFEIEFGYRPRLPWDWERRSDPAAASSPRERLNQEEAQAFARRAYSAWAWAIENTKQAQKRQQAQANQSRREPDFGPGDLVWLVDPPWRSSRPSPKLDWRKHGPYRILGKEGHSYRLELPPSIRAHPVFHAEKLRKAAEDPLPGQEPERPPPLEVDGEQEYEVDEILASRLHYGKLQYRVSWKGWDPDPEWYPASDFKNAARKLQDYHTARPNEPPPKNLDLWINLRDADRTPEPCAQDELPAWKPTARTKTKKKRGSSSKNKAPQGTPRGRGFQLGG